MSETVQSQGYNVSVEASRQSSSAVGRSNTAGTRFVDIFRRLLGRGSKRPVAYVRTGKEVSFENIPFVDSSGSRLKIARNSDGETVISRKGRLGTSSKTVDAVLRREKALSGNQGVSRAIPQFRSRAYKHLKETEDLRNGIITGDLETPGNSSSRLLKKLKAEQEKDGVAVDAAWLEQVKQHLNRTKSSGAANLKAAAAALKGADGKKDVEELADPRRPRVTKYAPKRVIAEETDHLVSTRKGKANGKASVEDDEITALKEAAKKSVDKTVNAGREVVQRISIQKEKPVVAPGESESRSLQIVRQLKKNTNGTSAETNDSQTTHVRKSVDDMQAKGWRVHTPINQRSHKQTENATGDALRGDRRVEQSPKKDAGQTTNETGQQLKKEQDDSAKPSDLARVQASSGSSVPRSNPQNGTNGTQHTQSQIPSASQEASKGLQNLDQLLARMETSARVLTGNGQTTMIVRLYPPELGSLSVRIRESNGKYNVTMDAENEKAVRAIEKQIPVIREHLNNRGIQVDQIQVRQGGEQEADSFANTFDQREDSERSVRKGRPRGHGIAGSEVEETQVSASNQRTKLQLGTNTMEEVG
ncbi:MAG: flagellar hook-length control protein FliK [bacterium]